MTGRWPRIAPLGDSALTVSFAGDFDARATAQARAFARAVTLARLPAVIEAVPGYVAVTVHYDPLLNDFATLREEIRRLIAVEGQPAALPSTTPPLVIPVRYDGPDLEWVATRTGLSPAEVVARHTAPVYEVALLGFVPGFVYCSGLDPALILPRRQTPRTRVPQGSVAIAGAQAGVYPAATPGGWHLLGTTDVRLFDPSRVPPMMVGVGDRIRFVVAAS